MHFKQYNLLEHVLYTQAKRAHLTTKPRVDKL